MKIVCCAFFLVLTVGCQAKHGHGAELPREPVAQAWRQRAEPVHEDSTTALLEVAIADGREKSLRKLSRKLTRRQTASLAAHWLLQYLRRDLRKLDLEKVQAAVTLYLMLPKTHPEHLFEVLIASKHVEVRHIAWQIAIAHPSPQIARAVERELMRRGALGSSPEVALAASANRMKDAYPLIRQALMGRDHVMYARALIELNPNAAADDLLSYLAQEAEAEVLLGKFESTSRAIDLLALRHFRTYPPSILHPAFRQLFYFASSQDLEISKEASQVLVAYAARGDERFSHMLVQLPPQLKAAFLKQLQDGRWPFGRELRRPLYPTIDRALPATSH